MTRKSTRTTKVSTFPRMLCCSTKSISSVLRFRVKDQSHNCLALVSTSASDVSSMRGRGSRDVIDIQLAVDSGRMADIANQTFRTQSGALVRVSVQESMRAVGENWSGLSETASRRGY